MAMNILRVPDTAALSSGLDTARPTSCEGYVTKRGHFRKSWRVRFLVLDGADLLVSYYDSRDACHPPSSWTPKGETTHANAEGRPPVPKGSFYLSSIEPHEYVVGVMGAAEKPFGFKMVGHAPRKGYVELDVFVETLNDRNKWLAVARNALRAKQQRLRQAIDQSVSPPKKSFFGFNVPLAASPPPQQQIKTLAKSKELLLADALREVEAAKLVGREACTEMVAQGEKLDTIEQDLGAIDRDLDYGDKLLRRLKSPTLHLFSSDARPKDKSGDKKPQHDHTEASSHALGASSSPPAGGHVGLGAGAGAGASDLERLALALGELEMQAEVLNGEAVRSTQQISRIEEKLTTVTGRVEKQTSQAAARLRTGGNLF